MEGSGVSKSEKDTSYLPIHGAAINPRQVTAFNGCSVRSVPSVKKSAQQRLMMFGMTSSLRGPLKLTHPEAMHLKVLQHQRWKCILFQAPPWCISKIETYCQASKLTAKYQLGQSI